VNGFLDMCTGFPSGRKREAYEGDYICALVFPVDHCIEAYLSSFSLNQQREYDV